MEDYNKKAEMILSGGSVLLDDGKIVMMKTKLFNDVYNDLYSKSIAKEAMIVEGNPGYCICPGCKTYYSNKSKLKGYGFYCSLCGQYQIIPKDEWE